MSFSKVVMASSAIVMALAGLFASFMPQEILARVGITPHDALVLLLQISGALYLGFAMLNWMAKDSVIGGIYNRPIAIGNLLHFMVAALALVKGVRSTAPPLIIALAIVYAIFAICFARIAFTSPVKRTDIHTA
jgi:hypothetical protein